MKIVIVYILLTYPPFIDYARRFIATYLQYPPGFPHTLIVVRNDYPVDDFVKTLFKNISCVFVSGDNEGQDIGAHQAVSHVVECDLMVCLGSSVHFRKSGWLNRIVQAFNRHGPGMYGASGSYQINPHIQTTAFWCSPELIRAYPVQVKTREQRYEFEHGHNSICALAASNGYPCKVVTWDGEYDYPEWRKSNNCSYKGDQSNMLMFWNITDRYESESAYGKRDMEIKANGG